MKIRLICVGPCADAIEELFPLERNRPRTTTWPVEGFVLFLLYVDLDID